MERQRSIVVKTEDIKAKIFTLRGRKVILDRDIAELYGVQTKVLNQAIQRNKERFPKDFMFKLKKEEFQIWKSQFVTSKSLTRGLRKLPYAFTEQGVANLSSVLRSKKAIEVNILIIRTFVQMRRFLEENNEVLNRMLYLERKQILFEAKTDKNFNKVFNYLQTNTPKKGIFFEGQIFDAYEFLSNLVKSAEKEIRLIDNFIDESVLTLFSKRKRGVKVIIYTEKINKALKLDLEKFNSQYEYIEIRETNKFHDRFLILDQENIFHIGASLKDLGKKCFGFSKFEKEFFNIEILKEL